jgi:signal transduction histidine kinase
VRIENIVVDGVSRPRTASLVVGPGRPNVELRYAGLSLTGPEHLTFRYRLENFDEDWVEAGSRRVAYYPRLPPGEYRFLVAAANREGAWSDAARALELRVVAPFWSTTWFRIGAIGAGLGLIMALLWRRDAAARRWRAAQEEFSRKLIESQEHERKRIAGELHDGLGQELLVVKNRALLALKADGVQPAAREQLQHINEVAARSLEVVRGLAHHLTPHQLDHLGLSAALRSMIGDAAASVDMEFRVTVEPVDGLIAAEHEINLYRIVQEAVSNVVRHSEARTVAVDVRRVDHAIVAKITDDGRGFVLPRDGAGRLALGFGLSSITERARILGGRVDVLSTPGGGTTIEVVAPVTRSAAAAP